MTISDPLVNQVKSRLLPPTSWESLLEKLIERLPRQRIDVNLIPRTGIVVIDENKEEFRAIDHHSFFTMSWEPSPSLEQGAWYYLEAALVRHSGSREACILAEMGDGSDTMIIPVPTNLRGSVREVFYLPPAVKALYWSPTATPGFFSQSPLLLHKITPLESRLRRTHRVLFDLCRFRKKTPATRNGLTWHGVLFNLPDAYQRSALLRFQNLRGVDYQSFIARTEQRRTTDLQHLQDQVAFLPVQPIFTLIIPVLSPNIALLSNTFQSLLAQPYPQWELIVAIAGTDEDVVDKVRQIVPPATSQITLVQLAPATGLIALLNAGIAQATGSFIARMDPGDQLSQYALLHITQEINRHPDAELIYTDHDLINTDNKRVAPHFKPEWNPDLLTSFNYVGRLAVYRTDTVRAVGGYREGFDGAEDFDLLLHSIQHISESNIYHIAKILYHCRTANHTDLPHPHQIDRDTVGERGRQAHLAGKKVLESFFAEKGTQVKDGFAPGLYRIVHPLPQPPPLVSIIIPTRNRADLLRTCIDSIERKTTYSPWEIIVVDNGSTDATTLSYFESLSQNPNIRVLRYDQPFNYSSINNYAVEHAHGEILALLNNDVEVIEPDWLTDMVSHALRPGIGAVGAKLLYPNSTVQHAGVILGLGGVAGHGHRFIADTDPGYGYRAVVTQNLSAVTGACLVVRKKNFQEVGGFNATDFAVAFNDVDFCLRLVKNGYRNVYTPHAKLFHHESMSRGRDDTPDKQAIFKNEYRRMKELWDPLLQEDPAYSPNLTKDYEDFSFMP